MSTKVETLRRELDSLLVREGLSHGDEGLTLIRPTKEQREFAVATAEKFPVKTVLTALGVLVAEQYAELLEAQGMRPADFWRMNNLSESVAAALSKALAENPPEFSIAFQATLKGRG
jgi:hypothetical protein